MPTCYKNIDHPGSIDLILTNKSKSFQNTLVIETVLSDFHRLTVTVMKVYFQKQAPKFYITEIGSISITNFSEMSFTTSQTSMAS